MHVEQVPARMQETARPVTRAQIESHSHKLQIIVTRHPVYFSHAALRLVHGDRILFWDPAGSYGHTETYSTFYKSHALPPGFSKHNDLITRGAPELSVYWTFARVAGDTGMEVLEWDLTPRQADHYFEILTQGAEGGEGYQSFRTQHPYRLCSSNLSHFLMRFTSDSVGLGDTYFFPHDLLHALYRLDPDRIIFFDTEQGVRMFTRSASPRTRSF